MKRFNLHRAGTIPVGHRYSLLIRYGLATIATLITVGLKLLLAPVLDDDAPLLLYVLPVLLSAWYGGLGPGLLATMLSLLSSTFLFVVPVSSWQVATRTDVVRLLVFAVEGTFISVISARLQATTQGLRVSLAAARSGEERLRLMVEGVREYAIFLLTPNGTVASWNTGAERIKGYTADESIGQPITRFYTNADQRDGLPQRLLAAAVDQGQYTAEGWQVRKDGSCFWATVVITALRDDQGVLQGFVKIIRDTTAQRQAEEERQAALAGEQAERQRVATILEHMTDAFFTLDRDWCFTSMNSKAEALLGRTADDLMGQHVWSAFPEAVDSDFYVNYRHVMATGQPVTFDTFYQPGATWYEARAYPDANGISVYLRDITARKEVEEALRLQDRAINAATNGIIITDARLPDHPIIYCNPAFERLTGYRPADALGRNCRFLQGPDTDPKVVATIREAVREQRECRVELLNYRQDGATFWNELTLAPVRDEAGQVINFIGVQTDISARKQAELALRDNQRFTQHVMETIPGLVYVFDLVGRRNVYANRQVADELGYIATDLQALGDTIVATLVHPDDLPAVAAHHERLRADRSGATYETIHRMKHRDGSWRWIQDRATVFQRDADGRSIQVLGYAQDVTERTQAAAALARSQAQFAGIIGSAMDAIITVDSTQHIRLFNHAAERMFGWKAEEMIGQRLDHLLPPSARSAHRHHIPTFGATGTTTRSMQSPGILTAVRSNGEVFPIEASISQIDVADEKLFTVILRDLTERERLEGQLRQAQKMESIGKLAGGIAHDFNNLLMAILGYANLALMSLPDDSPARDDLHEISQAGERAAALTKQILTFARQQSMQLETLDLNRVVLNVTALLQRVVNETITVVVLPSPEELLVQVDAGQIEQVLVNLAVNARDAMPDGGTLTIEIHDVPVAASQRLAHLGLMVGHYVRLVVTDTGIGMTDEVKQHIFEPFFTTKEVGKGTGLGLATSYGIVKQHGGVMTCESVLGRGATFTVYLPLVQTSEIDQTSAPNRLAYRRGQETVLVVEDEPAVRRLAMRVLREQGYRVYEAAHGAEALEVLEQQVDGSIHLILTDMVMPHLGGRSFLAQVQARWPQVKLLGMSGYTDTPLGEDGHLDGGIAFLHKPFTPHALLHKVREVFDG